MPIQTEERENKFATPEGKSGALAKHWYEVDA